MGAPIAGASAGHGLGSAISKWLGSGDYTVGQNSLVNSVKASGTIPMMHMNDQSIIVRHKEFLTEVRSSTSFLVRNSFTINPGSSKTFPWLSRLANCYQQYRIRGMVFHYVPTSGSAIASTNNALGSVMLQTSYRSNDSLPTSKIELLNEYWSAESMPSETFCHPIECNPAENPFNVQYVKSDDALTPTGDSPLLYDLGITHLCVSGQQASDIVLGDLWVTYEVELKKPILESNVTDSVFRYGYRAFATSPTFANPFGVGTATVGNLRFTTDTARSINIPAQYFGVFFIVVALKPSATFTTGVLTGAPVLTNCTLVDWAPGSDRYETSWGAVAGGNLYYCIKVSKLQRETTAGIQIPLASASAGTLAISEISIFGSPDIIP